jgi:hypothetical protein
VIPGKPPPPVSFVQPAQGWAKGPLRLAAVGIALSLLMSANLLVTAGIPYSVPYGPFVAKLHPGTYFIAAAFLWLAFRQNPFASTVEFARRQPAALALAAVALVMLVYSVVSYGPSGAAFLIDTLLAPALLALVLDAAHPSARRRVFLMVVAIMAINAVIGLAEASAQARLIPFMRGDKLIVEDFFRATALQGHPLSNAVRTLVVLLCCLSMIGRRGSGILVWLFIASLLAFGSRTGLVMAGALIGAWFAGRFFGSLRLGGFDPRRHLPMAIGAVVGLFTLVGLAVFTNLGQRIFSLFFFDESAKARIIVLRIFDLLTPADLLLGIGPRKIEGVLFLLSRTSTVTDIENVWLLFIMQFGLLLTVLFTIAFAGLLYSLAQRQPVEIGLAVVGFAVFMISNNALASKTQDTVMFVATVMGASAWAALAPRRQRAEDYLARYDARLYGRAWA